MQTRLDIPLVFTALLAASGTAHAQEADLGKRINAYRAAPGLCQGEPAQPVRRLNPEPALSPIRLRAGTILVAALDAAGYEAEQVEAIQVTGPADVDGAFDA